MTDKGYNLDAARVPEQAEQMRRLQETKICAFCPEHLETEHREPIELRSDHWSVAKNDYPYERTKLHLLIIAKNHARKLSDLTIEERHDLADLLVEVEKHWQLTSYAIGMRCGDMHYNGGSVDHLHAHVVVGDTDNPDHQPVRFKMSSRPKA